MQNHTPLGPNLGVELSRLSRFGANIMDAHTCFILLPLDRSSATGQSKSVGGAKRPNVLRLGGFHSLSTAVRTDARIEIGQGLVGFVSKSKQAVHISPFERDSRILGLYSEDVALKSFLGIPLIGQAFGPDAGVLACDSKKAYAFSKLQGKLIEELALEISRIVTLIDDLNATHVRDVCLKDFLERAAAVTESLGAGSVEVLRIKAVNLDLLEKEVGASKMVSQLGQILAAVRQAIPAQFPICTLPNGDVLALLDNMMTSYIENKLESLCQHLTINGKRFLFECRRAHARHIRGRSFTLEDLLALTAGPWDQSKGELNAKPEPGVRQYERLRA